MIKKPANITTNDWQLLNEKYPNNLTEIIKKINNNYPVQYLIGFVNFYGYKINVNEDVLIPRFETELLVEKTIKLIQKYNFLKPHIIDLATGSGCIAIALKKECLNSQITAIDYSIEALKQAIENSQKNACDIQFLQADLLNDKIEGKYDVIISNPPYVKKEQKVDPQVKYEPQNAIFAPEDGLVFYKKIAQISSNIIANKGIIALEIGYDQSNEVIKIFKNYFPNAHIYCEKDYNNFDRFVFVLVNCE